MEIQQVELPQPRWWPEPISADQFVAFAPEKLELVKGYLIDGPESDKARLELLALLLTNCGLVAAASLASKDDWREAMDHNFFDFHE